MEGNFKIVGVTFMTPVGALTLWNGGAYEEDSSVGSDFCPRSSSHGMGVESNPCPGSAAAEEKICYLDYL